MTRLLTLCLSAAILLTGCGSLKSPIDASTSEDLRDDFSALDGRYTSSGRPGPAEGVFALSCVPPVPTPEQGYVEVETQPSGDALTLAFYAGDTEAPFSQRTLRGTVNDDGIFESSTRWDACLNPYLFIILGWDVRRKKTYLALDENQDLIVGRAKRFLLIGLFVVPFYQISEQSTDRLRRVE